MFDVIIEEQKSQDDVDNIAKAVVKAVNSVVGVDSCDNVDSDLDEYEPEENDDE